MSNRTRQSNKGADGKMASIDSPEIPDRGETSEEPGLPSGLHLTSVGVLISIENNMDCERYVLSVCVHLICILVNVPSLELRPVLHAYH